MCNSDMKEKQFYVYSLATNSKFPFETDSVGKQLYSDCKRLY